MLPVHERFYERKDDEFVNSDSKSKEISVELQKVSAVNIANIEIKPTPTMNIDNIPGPSGIKRTSNKKFKPNIPRWLENLRREGILVNILF